jgi:hypothetical protein
LPRPAWRGERQTYDQAYVKLVDEVKDKSGKQFRRLLDILCSK